MDVSAVGSRGNSEFWFSSSCGNVCPCCTLSTAVALLPCSLPSDCIFQEAWIEPSHVPKQTCSLQVNCAQTCTHRMFNTRHHYRYHRYHHCHRCCQNHHPVRLLGPCDALGRHMVQKFCCEVVIAYNLKFSDYANTFAIIQKQITDLLQRQVWPTIERGLVRSMYLQGK